MTSCAHVSDHKGARLILPIVTWGELLDWTWGSDSPVLSMIIFLYSVYSSAGGNWVSARAGRWAKPTCIPVQSEVHLGFRATPKVWNQPAGLLQGPARWVEADCVVWKWLRAAGGHDGECLRWLGAKSASWGLGSASGNSSPGGWRASCDLRLFMQRSDKSGCFRV